MKHVAKSVSFSFRLNLFPVFKSSMCVCPPGCDGSHSGAPVDQASELKCDWKNADLKRNKIGNYACP